MDFSPDHANPNYDPNYNNSMSVTEEDEDKALRREFEGRAAASGKRKQRPLLSKEKIADAARAMEDESSLDQSKNLAEVYFVVYSQVEKKNKRDAKREELNLVERPNVEERVAAEQNAVEEKDNLKKRTIII